MKHPPRNIDQSCFDWQKIILKKTDLPYQSKYLALYLATYMNMNRDFAYPGLKTIERESGMSHATVIKYLDLLVSEGWIGKRSGDRTASNTYWITFPKGVGQEVTYVSSGVRVGRELTSNNKGITSTTTTKGKKDFVRPTIEQIRAYAQEKGFIVDTDYFFEFYSTARWLDAGGKQVRNWKLKLLTWNKREVKNENTNNATRQPQHQRGSKTQIAREQQRRREQSRAGGNPC